MTTERLLAKGLERHITLVYANERDNLWPTSNTATPPSPEDPDFPPRDYRSGCFRISDRYDWACAKDDVLNKETNMMNRLERRRHALNLRWRNKLKWYGAAAAGLFFGLPVVVKFSSLCWEWMLP